MLICILSVPVEGVYGWNGCGCGPKVLLVLDMHQRLPCSSTEVANPSTFQHVKEIGHAFRIALCCCLASSRRQ